MTDCLYAPVSKQSLCKLPKRNCIWIGLVSKDDEAHVYQIFDVFSYAAFANQLLREIQQLFEVIPQIRVHLFLFKADQQLTTLSLYLRLKQLQFLFLFFQLDKALVQQGVVLKAILELGLRFCGVGCRACKFCRWKSFSLCMDAYPFDSISNSFPIHLAYLIPLSFAYGLCRLRR